MCPRNESYSAGDRAETACKALSYGVLQETKNIPSLSGTAINSETVSYFNYLDEKESTLLCDPVRSRRSTTDHGSVLFQRRGQHAHAS